MSSFTGQPHQAGEFGVPITFQEGLNSDYAPEATPPTGYVSAGNMHLLRQIGSELLLGSDRGTQRRAQLPDNHCVLGSASRDGILYLVLAEVNNGVATGKGQIGTYPSPDYTYVDPANPASSLAATGNLTNDYRPLFVYLGDEVPYDQRPGPLVSNLFDFYLDRPLEVLIQPSYDGSRNLLIHDRGNSAALLINSGFRVTGDSTYELLTRTGQVSTNRYTGADFSGRLRQQLRPQTAAKLLLDEVTDGGRLLGGEYRYYLTYCDADGNQTAVACEVGPVSIFNGTSAGSSEGLLPGVNSSRRVRLKASNLDPQLGYARLAWVRRSGEPTAAAGSASRSAERFAIPASGELEILHTGLETEVALSIDELLPLTGQLHRFTTATASVEEGEGRLLVGGVETSAGTDDVRDALRAYARSCRLGHGIAQLHEPGLQRAPIANVSIPELYETMSPRTVQLDGFAGGYANPLNICYRQGYHDAEGYSWGLQGQLLDGSLTTAYPFCGLDNLDGLAAYVSDNSAGFYDEQGWSADRRQNIAGVYRFPRRGLGNVPAAIGSDGTVQVLRAEVTMAAFPLLLLQNLRAIRIVRSPRRANRQFQGYLIPTVRALAINPENDEEYDHLYAKLTDAMEGNTIANLKVLPAPQLTIEGSVHDFDNKGGERVPGVYPFRFWSHVNFNGNNLTLFDPLRWGLYAPDVYLQLGNLRQQLGGSNWQILPVALATAWREAKYLNVVKDQLNGGSWTIYKTAEHQLLPNQALQSARLYDVADNQGTPNTGRFASQETKLRGKAALNEEFYVINAAWEEYVGVEFGVPMPAASALNMTTTGGQTGTDLTPNVLGELNTPAAPLAIVVDIYGPEGVWDGVTLRQAYPVDTTTYFPISDWLSPTDVEQQLSAGRVLPVYGGDAILGMSFRRVTRALPNEQLPDGVEPQPLSQGLGILTSSTVNPWPRSIDGTVSSFPPRLGSEQGQLNAMRTYPYNTLKESIRYNAGYAASLTDSPPAVFVVRDNASLLPYARTLFPQRIWSTALATESALSNGWRYFPALLYKDYDIGSGKLVRLQAGPQGEILLIYEYGLGLIQLNERTMTGQEAGQPVYTQSLQLLPDRARIIASDLGCQHAFATDVSDLGVYGFDALRRVIWFYPWGSGKAVRITDHRVSTTLAPAAVELQGKPVHVLQADARVTYDPFRGDLIFNLYTNSAGL